MHGDRRVEHGLAGLSEGKDFRVGRATGSLDSSTGNDVVTWLADEYLSLVIRSFLTGPMHIGPICIGPIFIGLRIYRVNTL